MPRPKGSKNKARPVEAMTPEQYAERIAEVSASIQELAASLKAKKAELKNLEKGKAAVDAAAAAKKAEEDHKAILAAVDASGKTVDEILAMLKP